MNACTYLNEVSQFYKKNIWCTDN